MTSNQPLPEWANTLRPEQVEAVAAIREAFKYNDVVFLDAPVGTGKTLIGELVRRDLEVRHGLYICTDKQLQDQVLGDFPYAKVLKGRGNYIPPHAGKFQSCEDCTLSNGQCRLCVSPSDCPYLVARDAAIGTKRADGERSGQPSLAVMNTAYFLAAANQAKSLPRYDLIVADECDTLEQMLAGFVEFDMSEKIARRAGITAPAKQCRKQTLIAWFEESSALVRGYLERHRASMDVKEQNTYARCAQDLAVMATHLKREQGQESTLWLRDYGDDYNRVPVVRMRPVTVAHLGNRNLWRHGKKWLCMSGTVVSGDELADSLGVGLAYTTVNVGSGFPIENRRVILAPLVDVTYKAQNKDYDALATAIDRILERHEGRALVHTVSYKLASELAARLSTNRRVVTHANARGKQEAIDAYLSTPDAVILSPSMTRGVDLANDACRIQVIAKTPFLSLGDKQVAARIHAPGGQQWYAVQAVREIVQMTGRGVRHNQDTCVTYILDKQFVSNLWRKNEYLFPRYFRDAVDARADIRWMLG